MQILPGRIISGSIILNEKIPSLSLGRTVIATVLSKPSGGHVLVSLFGKRILVETTIPLQKGQVLNLKVQALNPRIILKPAAEQSADSKTVLSGIKTLLDELVGTFGKTPIKSFSAEEIIKTVTRFSPQDPAAAQFVSALLDQVSMHPLAVAYLLIPLAENDSRSHARVSIEKHGQAYTIHFEIDTDNLGAIECIARVDDRIDVEIRTPSEQIAEFLRLNIHELYVDLEPFGVRTCEVVHRQLNSTISPGVDVLV